MSVDQALMKAKSHEKNNEVSQAQNLYKTILTSFPKNIRAQQGLYNLESKTSNNVLQNPPQEIVNRLINLYKQGQFSLVVNQTQPLSEQFPKAFIIWNILGSANMSLGRLELASKNFLRVIELNPHHANAFSNLGVVLESHGKLYDAMEAYKKAILLKPEYYVTYFNLGNVLKKLGKLNESIRAYNKALSINPNYAEAYNNKGSAFEKKENLTEAIIAYNKALSLSPNYAEAYNNIGNIYKKQGELDKSIKAYNKALSHKPNYAEAHNNIGVVFHDQGKLDKAIESYNQSLLIKPDDAVRVQMLNQKAHICDWDFFDEGQKLVAKLGISGKAVDPFSMLCFDDSPERNLLRSEKFINEKFPQKSFTFTFNKKENSKRIRVGYFSADFHNHATMYLMAQIFVEHDKKQFEIFAYSYGPDKQDEMRNMLICCVDAFYDIRDMKDDEIVELARADKLDIAIDLKGFTKDQRLKLFSHGLAPVQISYLGYPGTLGGNFIDYLVADPIVILKEKLKQYSEKIIFLPNTYQPTDNKRVISKKVIKREDMGLPRDGFVFCCFNNNYKITPKEFDIWMQILERVNNSVLWLLKSNLWAEKNLKKEAEARGICESRLIFAKRVPQAEHLARYRLADLFIDTFNINAHTTASDALWAGLPVVTKLGQGFASRVAGSLLHAVGLQELVTNNKHDYKTLILKLAKNEKMLSKIKEQLAYNISSQPLFDSKLYTKHLENGYLTAYQNYIDGNDAKNIIVSKKNHTRSREKKL